MCCVGRVSTAALAAVAFSIGCICGGASPVQAGDDGARLLFFSGADLWRDGDFLHGGVLWSPDGLDREGFTLKAMLAGGRYRYISGALGDVWVTGTEADAQILPGWRFKRDRLEVKIFAGLDVKYDITNPYDPGNRLHGASAGVLGAVDLWFEPTPDTMLAANASVTSIAGGYSARVAYGWRLMDWFYVGPEAQAFACVGYDQERVGMHMTGLKTGDWEWSAAAGWSTDSDSRSGPYVRLGVLTRR